MRAIADQSQTIRIPVHMQASRVPLSLETPVGEMEDVRLGDFLGDEDAVAPLDEASKALLKEELESALGTVREREKRVIQLRFGLLDGHPRTLEEVGLDGRLDQAGRRDVRPCLSPEEA